MSRRHRPSSNPEDVSATRSHRAAPRNQLTPLWIALAVLLLVGAGFLLLRQQSGLPSEIPVSQAHDMYLKGALFVDVRTQQEWDQGHIANSILIPLDVLQSRMGELPRDRDIVVVCHSGARSKQGSSILRQGGFVRATCMNGGIQAWVTAGYPLAN